MLWLWGWHNHNLWYRLGQTKLSTTSITWQQVQRRFWHCPWARPCHGSNRGPQVQSTKAIIGVKRGRLKVRRRRRKTFEQKLSKSTNQNVHKEEKHFPKVQLKNHSRGGNRGCINGNGKPHTRSRQGHNPCWRVIQAGVGQAGKKQSNSLCSWEQSI